MEWQAYHIQVLLADELDQYKGKGGEAVDKHIKILQDTYQDIYQDIPQLIIINNQHLV